VTYELQKCVVCVGVTHKQRISAVSAGKLCWLLANIEIFASQVQ